MSFPKPTLKELVARIQADMESQLKLQPSHSLPSPVLRRSVLSVLAHAVGGSSYMLQGFLDYLAKQVMVDTAESSFLHRWGHVWGIYPKPAAFAQGLVVFKGNEGAPILKGITLRHKNNVMFIVEEEAIIQQGEAVVKVVAQQVGLSGNLPADTPLFLISPVMGVEAEVIVGEGGIQGGCDIEDDESFRARILKRIQAPPHGGALEDYETWGLEMPSVTNVWVFPKYLGLSTVGVTFAVGSNPLLLPNATQLQTMQTHLNERRPVTSEVIVFSPRGVALDFVLEITPNTTALQNAITEELRHLIWREACPGASIRLSHIHEVISLTAGIEDYTVFSPTTNVTYSLNEIPELGHIHWQKQKP